MANKVLAGRYEIIEKIGDGGMAVVYKARDKLLNRFVAVKILRPEYIKDTVFVENFRKESKAAASLQHPNIVTIYDVGKDGDVHFIVMEYVEGSTLSELIAKEAPLDYKKCIFFAKQISSALSLAHRNNIIHRDVKPHNILITNDGTAKITDFGIAKAVSDGTIINDNGVIMGSVHYFSPEQSRGQYVDEKSDIYSLGIVIYEMLTGRVPFDADNPVTIAVMHMNDSIIPPSRLVTGVPPGLDQIVLKATAKFQSDRFKSMDEMFQALDNVNYITGVIDDPEIAGFVAPTNIGEENVEKGYSNATGEEGELIGVDDFEDEDFVDNEYPYDDEKTDEEEETTKKGKGSKKFSKKNRNIAIIIAIVAALLISFGLFKLIAWMTSDKMVDVPDLIGMTEDEAKAELDKVGLTLKVEGTISLDVPDDAPEDVKKEIDALPIVDANDDPIEEGEIITQSPVAGRKAEKNSEVKVKIVGPPPEEGKVPDVMGKTKESAEFAINQAGFILGDVTYVDSDEAVDTVIEQSPVAGTDAEKDSKVNITISQGKKVVEVKVPNLEGLTEAGAKAALENVNLKLGSVAQDFSNDFDKGLVMWQEYKANSTLNEGQSVGIRISLGPKDDPEPPPTPTTVKVSVDFSSAPSDSFTLTVQFVDSSGTPKNIINEAERQKSQGPESVSVTGTGTGKVNVFFNGAMSRTYTVDFSTGKVS